MIAPQRRRTGLSGWRGVPLLSVLERQTIIDFASENSIRITPHRPKKSHVGIMPQQHNVSLG